MPGSSPRPSPGILAGAPMTRRGWRRSCRRSRSSAMPWPISIAGCGRKHATTSILFWPARNRVYWQPKGVVLIIVALELSPAAHRRCIGGSSCRGKPRHRQAVRNDASHGRRAQAHARRCAGTRSRDGGDRRRRGGRGVVRAAFRSHSLHRLHGGRQTRHAGGRAEPYPRDPGAGRQVAGDRARRFRPCGRGPAASPGASCSMPGKPASPPTTPWCSEARLDEFVRLFQEAAARFYPRVIDNPDYTSIVNQRHYDRLVDLAADARSKGARLVTVDPARELPAGEIGARTVRKIAPVVATGVTDDMAMMREEIFGPILPVVTYETLDEAIAYVNARPRPLALYYFDGDRTRVDHVTAAHGLGRRQRQRHLAPFRPGGLALRRHRPERHGCLPRSRRLPHLQPRQGRIPAKPLDAHRLGGAAVWTALPSA